MEQLEFSIWTDTQTSVTGLRVVLFNPKTASWGPFGPQTMLTTDIFVTGLINLSSIFIAK